MLDLRISPSFYEDMKMIYLIKDFFVEYNAANTNVLANLSSFLDELVAFEGSTRVCI